MSLLPTCHVAQVSRSNLQGGEWNSSSSSSSSSSNPTRLIAMGVSWQRVKTSCTRSPQGSDTVGGAVPCVIGNRIYLVGGSGKTANDPDLALEMFSFPSNCCVPGAERDRKSIPSEISFERSTAGDDKVATSATSPAPASAPAPAPASTIAMPVSIADHGVQVPTLTRMTVSQEGEIPTARIGHSAVTLVNPQSSASSQSQVLSIYLFGGEAPTPSPPTSADEKSKSPVYRKLADVYEGTPKLPSGSLVWRLLTLSIPETPEIEPTNTGATNGIGNGGGATSEGAATVHAPAPTAFQASCTALVRNSMSGGGRGGGGGCDGDGSAQKVLLVHGGISQSSELLDDLWAFFPDRLSNVALGGPGDAIGGGKTMRDERSTGWERLVTQGEGPPPAAYHTATPVNEGRIVVFIGGGKSWGAGLIFLLEAVALHWSSFEVTGGISSSGQRCLHSAISVTGIEIDHDGDDQRQNAGESAVSPSSDTLPDLDNAATTPPSQVEGSSVPPAAPVQLWDPVTTAGGIEKTESVRSASAEKPPAATSSKKKPGSKEKATAAKKASNSNTAGSSGGGGRPGAEGTNNDIPEAESGPPPIFESVLIFGGIFDESVVSGEACVLRHDGTVTPLYVGRESCPNPGPRFNHAMVSVQGCTRVESNDSSSTMSINSSRSGSTGSSSSSSSSRRMQLAFLFGGCRGDGTRVTQNDTFSLELVKGGEMTPGGDADYGGDDVDGEDTQNDRTIIFGDGDVYTGETDCDGLRQGKGRCVYGAAVGTAEGASAKATAGGSGGSGGSYVGDWDADEPHGRGERHYARPTETGGEKGGIGGGVPTSSEDEDTAIVQTAFGSECPPLASYRGDFKRGVREGNGCCSFFTPAQDGAPGPDGCHASAGALAGVVMATKHGHNLAAPSALIPDSYDGEWVGGRPHGRGILSLRASLVRPSESAMTREGGKRNGGGRDCFGGGDCWIKGTWTEEGLVHGREKLPGNRGFYEGQYRHGKREGYGKLELPDGSEYEGAWRNGRQNGIGTFRCGVTRHVYTGKWVGGVRCGRGVCEYASGSRYEGLWHEGLRHGEGVLSNLPGGGETLAGVWQRDEFNQSHGGAGAACPSTASSVMSDVQT